MFVRVDSSFCPLQHRLKKNPDGLFTSFLDSWSGLVVSSGLSTVDLHVFQKTSPNMGLSPAAVQVVQAHWGWTEWKDFSHVLSFCLYYYNFCWFCKYFFILSSQFTMVSWITCILPAGLYPSWNLTKNSTLYFTLLMLCIFRASSSAVMIIFIFSFIFQIIHAQSRWDAFWKSNKCTFFPPYRLILKVSRGNGQGLTPMEPHHLQLF